MKKIVYLMGAGASCNAVPIVKIMPRRIRIFLRVMQDYCKKNGINESTLDKYNALTREIEFFTTPDTLARKYFLSKNRYSDELIDLKNLLSAFFIFEQLEKDTDLQIAISVMEADGIGLGLSDEIKEDESFKNYFETIDKRYLSFFATISNIDSHGKILLPKNISIISWNYDMQFERGFQEYTNSTLAETQEHLNIYPVLKNRKQDISDNALNEFSVLKLNGTAGFYSRDGHGGNIFDPKRHTTDNETMEIFCNILTKFRFKSDYNHLLNFAWENNEERVVIARKMAKRKIQNADVVVIIGYSFPDFNRIIDKEIFSGLDDRKTEIFLQDPNANYIIQKLDGVSYGLTEKTIPITETSNFNIPFKFWE